MDRFWTDVIVLHSPTGEIKRYREDFDTMGEAISKPCEFLRHLQDDPDVEVQSDSLVNLNGQQEVDEIEEIFICYFRIQARDEFHGMILVTALHDRIEPAGE
jgi:hypothetical protein